MLDVPMDLLREAVSVWLQNAYPRGNLNEAVRSRLAVLDAARPLSELLGDLPFEHYTVDAPSRCEVYALRLGCEEYPHLKLEIRPFPNRFGFVFWVNTHDQFFTPDARCRDADRWAQLMLRNRELKEQIEHAWAEHDLPTFTSAMRESLSATACDVR